jgi:predicted PurR-regulated permease PerM
MIEVGIIGLLNFIGMMILQLPYATLISVMVAFANIIPFFGAYIGCALGAAIIILVNPWQALVFIIFQIVLLQIDGNLIGPKLLGHSIGLSALWVIVAVLLFTGCFGMWGAFIGVPLFAWIYYLIKRLAEQLLEKQGMPVETEAYMDQKTIPDSREQRETDSAEEEEAGKNGSGKRGRKRSRKKRKNG